MVPHLLVIRSIAIGLRGIDNDQDHILIRYYGMQELLGMNSDGFPVENAWCLEAELGHRDIKSYAVSALEIHQQITNKFLGNHDATGP